MYLNKIYLNSLNEITKDHFMKNVSFQNMLAIFLSYLKKISHNTKRLWQKFYIFLKHVTNDFVYFISKIYLEKTIARNIIDIYSNILYRTWRWGSWYRNNLNLFNWMLDFSYHVIRSHMLVAEIRFTWKLITHF